MKSLYRCIQCYHYSLKSGDCKVCGNKKSHPYPARFSLIKEKKYRKFNSKLVQNE